MLKRILPVTLFVGLLVFLAIGLQKDPRHVPSPLIGKPAPQFSLPLLSDPEQQAGLARWRGEPLLINVWGSWCIACSQEHDFLMELARRGEVRILGLNWKDERGAAGRWLRERGNPYIASVFDGDGRVGIDYGVYGAPETFLLDSEQRIVRKHVGPLDAMIWERDFRPLLDSASR